MNKLFIRFLCFMDFVFIRFLCFLCLMSGLRFIVKDVLFSLFYVSCNYITPEMSLILIVCALREIFFNLSEALLYLDLFTVVRFP